MMKMMLTNIFLEYEKRKIISQKASMNTVKTAVEQMKLAEAQEDLESKQIAQMRLRQSVGLPVI